MLLNSPLLCPSWSLLMQETLLLLWGLFLVDLLLWGVEELEEAWGVVWGGVVEGGEVERVRGGGKPKLAGPQTWVRSTLRNVSNNGFKDKSLRPLQLWGSCCCLTEPFFSSRVCPLHPIQSKAHKSFPNTYQKQASSSSCLLAVTACTYPLLGPRFNFKLPVARFFQHDAITAGRWHPYLRHSLEM